jgi:hypothetical protein
MHVDYQNQTGTLERLQISLKPEMQTEEGTITETVHIFYFYIYRVFMSIMTSKEQEKGK